MADPDRFAELVHNLPPELFLEIYQHTFAANIAQISINWNYKPLNLLQVDRASRELFAANYYKTTTFVARTPLHCRKWLMSMPHGHVALLREVRLLYLCSAHQRCYPDGSGLTVASSQQVRDARRAVGVDLKHWIARTSRVVPREIGHISFRVRLPRLRVGLEEVFVDVHGDRMP